MSEVTQHSLPAELGAPQASPVLFTIPEAASLLRISKWTLYQLIRSRQLETIRIGTRRFVPPTAVHALVERLRAEENI